MATTVKSLDERIDGVVDTVDRFDARLEKMLLDFAGFSGEFAGLRRELVVFREVMAAFRVVFRDEMASFRAQIAKQAEEFAAFRAKTDTSMALVRWFGVTLAGLGVLVIGQGFSVAQQAGRLEANVNRQQERLDKSDRIQDELIKTMKDLPRDVAEFKSKTK